MFTSPNKYEYTGKFPFLFFSKFLNVLVVIMSPKITTEIGQVAKKFKRRPLDLVLIYNTTTGKVRVALISQKSLIEK